MSVELSIALLFSSKTIPSASSLKYVLYRWVTLRIHVVGSSASITVPQVSLEVVKVQDENFEVLNVNSH